MDLITQCLEDDSIWEEVGTRTGLTPAVLEVMRLACSGMHTGQIVRELGRSPKTVHAHRARSYDALNVTCLEAAIRKLLSMAVEIHMERPYGQQEQVL